METCVSFVFEAVCLAKMLNKSVNLFFFIVEKVKYYGLHSRFVYYVGVRRHRFGNRLRFRLQERRGERATTAEGRSRLKQKKRGFCVSYADVFKKIKDLIG